MINFVAYRAVEHPSLVKLASKLPVISEKNPTTWVNVARVGTWKGHHQGAFEITRETFKEFMLNFDGQANPIVITWEHGSLPGLPRPAAGWIRQLETRDGGDTLWALCEFTNKAADMIREGEYRFCSIVFNLQSEHRETKENIGAELRELGLTNTPFIDSLESIKLSRVYSLAEKGDTMKDSELIAEALEALGPDASIDQVVAWVEAEKQKKKVEEGGEAAPTEEPAAEPAEASRKLAEGDEMAPEGEGEAVDEDAVRAAAVGALEALADELAVDLPTLLATMDEKRDDLVALLGGAAAEDGGAAEAEVEFVNSRNVALSRDVEQLQKRVVELEGQRVADQVDLALSNGTLVGERDKLIKAASDMGLERLVELSASMGATVPTEKQYRSATRGAVEDGSVELSQLDPSTQRIVRHLMADGRKQEQAIKLALKQKEN